MAKAFDQRDCPNGGHTPENEQIPSTPLGNVPIPAAGPSSGESQDFTGGTMTPPTETQKCQQIKLKNVSGFKIPANSAVEPVKWEKNKIEIDRPTADNLSNALIVEEEIEIDGELMICWPPDCPRWVAYKVGETLKEGDELGTVEDQWYMSNEKSGFIALGDGDLATGLVPVCAKKCDTVKIVNDTTVDIPPYAPLKITDEEPDQITVNFVDSNEEDFITFPYAIPATATALDPFIGCRPDRGWPKVVRTTTACVADDWIGTDIGQTELTRADRYNFTVMRIIDTQVGYKLAEVMPSIFPTAGTATADIPADTVGAVQRTDGDFGAVGLPVNARNAGQGQINTGQHCVLGVYKGKPFCLSSGGSSILLHNVGGAPIIAYGMMEIAAGSTPDQINVQVPTADSKGDIIVDDHFPNPLPVAIPAGATIAVPRPCPSWPMWVVYGGSEPAFGEEVGVDAGSCAILTPIDGEDHFGFTVVDTNSSLSLALIRPVDWPVPFLLKTDIEAKDYGSVTRCTVSGGELGTEFDATNISTDCNANENDVVMGGIAPSGDPFFEGGVAP